MWTLFVCSAVSLSVSRDHHNIAGVTVASALRSASYSSSAVSGGRSCLVIPRSELSHADSSGILGGRSVAPRSGWTTWPVHLLRIKSRRCAVPCPNWPVRSVRSRYDTVKYVCLFVELSKKCGPKLWLPGCDPCTHNVGPTVLRSTWKCGFSALHK
jgi:hypothetical protein